MATLTAAAALGVDLTGNGFSAGNVSNISTSVIRYAMPNAVTLELTGTFTLTDTLVTGGTATGLSAYSSGVLVYSVTGLSLSATAVLGSASTNGWTGLQDTLFGGADTFTLGAGNDIVYGRDGADSMSAGDGADFVYGGPGSDTQNGGAGNDVMDGGLDADTLFGGEGGDALGGAAGNDVIFGEGGVDYVVAGVDNDTVDGGAGNDLLRGQLGDDSIRGGDGDDRIWGDKGTDTVTGGNGADTFIVFAQAGATTVTDFSFAAGDRVGLEGGTAYSISGNTSLMTITFGEASVTLSGIALSTFSADWITFL